MKIDFNYDDLNEQKISLLESICRTWRQKNIDTETESLTTAESHFNIGVD